MARRKLQRGAEEIEYRLLEIIKRRDPIDPRALTARLASIAALAEMWKVELGPTFHSLVEAKLGIRKNSKPVDFASPETKMPEQQLPDSEGPEEPTSGGSILDEMGEN